MSKHDPDPEDAEEEPDIELADPDDYHRRQRLKEIHDARQEVAQKVADLDIHERKTGEIRWYSIQELSHATAMYVNELLPLIEHTDVSEEDMSLPDGCYHDDITQYAKSMGVGDDNKPVNPTHSLEVYRTCNQILADVKPLITDDEADEWEV